MSQILNIILVGIVIGSCQGQFDFGSGWVGGLFDNINVFNKNIESDIARVNQEIQQNVQKQLDEVDKRNKEIFADIEKSQKNGATFSGVGQSVIVSDTKGSQRTIISGRTKSGELYYRETEDKVINNVLHHTDRVYDSNNKIINEHSYTLDLSDPNAKPIPVTSKLD